MKNGTNNVKEGAKNMKNDTNIVRKDTKNMRKSMSIVRESVKKGTLSHYSYHPLYCLYPF